MNKRATGMNKNTKICYICNEEFKNKYLKDAKYCKVRKKNFKNNLLVWEKILNNT